MIDGSETIGNVSFTSWILRCYPPLLLQFYFFKRLVLSEIWAKSLKTIGKAFCGNGFIHLNIAEIHEEGIGGQKTSAYFGNQGSKWVISR